MKRINFDPSRPVDPMSEPLEDMQDAIRRQAGEHLLDILNARDESAGGATPADAIRSITDKAISDVYGEESLKLFTEDGLSFDLIEAVASWYWLAPDEYRHKADELTNGGAGRLYWIEDRISKDWAVYEAANERTPDISMSPDKNPEDLLNTILKAIDDKPPLEDQYRTLQGVIKDGVFDPAITNAAIQKITAKPIDKTDIQLDKVNGNIWDYLEGADANGQLALNIGVERKGSGKEINVAYSVNFDELDKIDNLKITRRLTPYDHRVHNAVSALFNAGYEVMGIRQIYNAMGRTGSAGKGDIEKINDSLTKMAGAHIFIDNYEESTAYSSKPHFKYDGKALPMERITAEINGNVTDAAIHLFREPPLMSFARERKQITTIKVRLLDSPLKRTDDNIRLEDYLIEETARIKNGKRQAKIRYETLFKDVKANTPNKRKRAKERAPIFLDHLIREGFIKGYNLLDDGIQIRP